MARPSLQFYPDDWMNDLGLRSCSLAARAIWVDLICLMHQGEPYGHLAGAAGPLPVKMVAFRCGVPTKVLIDLLHELEKNNVFSRDDSGTIFSRRMVRDEHNRFVRGQGGVRSLMCPAVPKPKGILKGILPSDGKGILSSRKVKGTFDPVDEEEEAFSLKNSLNPGINTNASL